MDSKENSKIRDFKCCINFIEKMNRKWVDKESRVNDEFFELIDFKSLEYKPPIVFSNGFKIEHSDNFWALGISVYKMISGHFPFLNSESTLYGDIPDLEEMNISQQAKEYVKCLLNKNQGERLGSRKNTNKVKKHSFFKQINWEKLEKHEIKPPFEPVVVRILKFNYKYHKI